MTQSNPKCDSNVYLISAGAGTGKTTRLVNEIVNAILGIGYEVPIHPSKILVSTFTKKAADELIAKIREELIHLGKWEAAQLLFTGYVGTVNSICSQLLCDFALESGLSPRQNVIPEEMQDIIFAIATGPVIDAFTGELEDIAARLSYDDPQSNMGKGKYAKPLHWTQAVRDVCDCVRTNNIDRAMLEKCAERSWAGLKSLLPPRACNIRAGELDKLLADELEETIHALRHSNDETKKTCEQLKRMTETFVRAKQNRITWADWAVMSRIDTAKESVTVVSNLRDIAKRRLEHPQFHDDLELFISAVFKCAEASLDAYEQYKLANGLLDFTDQERLALNLSALPQMQDCLRERIQLVMIDEFQDTSPIQLSLFLQLGEIAQRSFWVGDIKQAIYGFRGTDPKLMHSAAEKFEKIDRLSKSFRARRELVALSNEIFSRVLPQFGFSQADIILEAARNSVESRGAPIELWRCTGSKLEGCFSSLAIGVLELLRSSPSRQVFDKSMNQWRDILGSDVAILSRSNERCEGVAAALAAAGQQVAMTTTGLLDTPECVFALAAFYYLVDGTDSLALAQLVHLTRDYAIEDQSTWLNDWLTCEGHAQELLPQVDSFEQARRHLTGLSLTGCFDYASNCANVFEHVARWGDVSQRLANLDGLRGLIVKFQDECSIAQTPVTVHGCINHFRHLQQSRRPPSGDPHAVRILTYHGAKGLEWPVVILADLDKDSSPSVRFDLCRVSVQPPDRFNVTEPLAGRSIQFWPWPYGLHKTDADFDPMVVNTTNHRRMVQRLLQENIRLLYVGITRARDLLVFAPYCGRRGGGTGTQWLEELRSNDTPVLQFPGDESEERLLVGDTAHPIKIKVYRSEIADPCLVVEPIHVEAFLPVVREAQNFLPFILKPSEQTSWTAESLTPKTSVIDIGDRIPLVNGAETKSLGDCVHSFLASDDPSRARGDRLRTADDIRELWGLTEISGESLVEASDRLYAFVYHKFGQCRWHKECPVRGRIGNQRVHGVIDLLLETQSQFYLFDHKTFHGPADKWVDKALSFLPQLMTYRDVLSQASSKPVAGMLIHLPIIGKIVNIDMDTTIDPFVEKVLRCVAQAAKLYFRLMLLVGLSESSKALILKALLDRTGGDCINVGVELSNRLTELSERQRTLRLPQLLEEIISASNTEVAVLDNIEILFDLSLKQDPLRLLQMLSRNRTLIIIWNGSTDGHYVFYAKPNEAEYRKYKIGDFLALGPEGGASESL